MSNLDNRCDVFTDGVFIVGRADRLAPLATPVRMTRIMISLDGPFQVRLGPHPWQSVTSLAVASSQRVELAGAAPLVRATLLSVHPDAAGRLSTMAALPIVNVTALEDMRAALVRDFTSERTGAAEGWYRELGAWAAKAACLRRVDDRIARAVQEILHHPSLGVGDMARRVGLSRSRFSHLFSEELGATYQDHVMLMRLRSTIANMAGNVSLTQAALSAGFGDLSHCSRTFRRHARSALKAYLADTRIRVDA